jgi:hypothetical protein
MSTTPYTEPWLRDTYADVPAASRTVLHALDLADAGRCADRDI